MFCFLNGSLWIKLKFQTWSILSFGAFKRTHINSLSGEFSIKLMIQKSSWIKVQQKTVERNIKSESSRLRGWYFVFFSRVPVLKWRACLPIWIRLKKHRAVAIYKDYNSFASSNSAILISFTNIQHICYQT